MGWLLISGFIVAVVMVLTYFFDKKRTPIKEWYKIEEYVIHFYISLFMSLILVALFAGIYTGTSEGVVREDGDKSHCTESVNSWHIISAVRDKTISSSFILGTGGSTQIDRYYAYQDESRGMKLTTYYANRTFVVEQDGSPRYERIDWICPRPIADFMWWSNGHTKHNYGKEGTLYVPHGTILREFRM